MLTTLGSLSAAVEILNALGVIYLATKHMGHVGVARARHYTLGQNLLRASQPLQLAVIALFGTLASIFHRRCTCAAGPRILHPRVRAVLHTLYASMLLILGRTVYRAVEHFSGGEGVVDATTSLSPVARYEWFFYVFVAALMLVNAVGWNARHPGRYLPHNYRRYFAQDGKTELDWPRWCDKRNVVMTVVDPFGLVATCENGRTGEAFWQDNGYHHPLELKGQRESS